MKKNLYLLAMLATLGGCAVTAPVQTYRAAGQVEAWHVSGRLDTVSQLLTVTVNGQDAISGKLSLWDGSGTVAGVYQGKPISATCRHMRHRKECTVLVGSEVAANLTF